MKKIVAIVCFACALSLFCLAGCGAQSQKITTDNVKGTWKSEAADVGFDSYIKISDDNYVEFIFCDTWLSGTMSTSDKGANIKFKGVDMENDKEVEITANLSLIDNKLVLGKTDGSKLILAKNESDGVKKLFDRVAQEEESAANAEANAEAPEANEVVTPLGPIVIADDDRFALSVIGKGTDSTGDPGYKLLFNNKTDKPVTLITLDPLNVDGKMIESGLADEIEGKSSLETFLYFDKDEFGAPIEDRHVVDGAILVYDEEGANEIASYKTHIEG